MLSPTSASEGDSSLKDLLSPFTSNYDEGAYIQALLVSQNVSSVLQGLQQVIQRIDGEIHRQVVSHHKDLFQQMGQICEIESKLLATTTRLKHLQKSVSRLNQGVLRPFSVMQKTTMELRNLNSVTDILRSVGRVTYLVERLKVTLKIPNDGSNTSISLAGVSARDMTKAAVYLAEIKNILEETNLNGVHATAQHLELCDSLNVSVRQFANTQLQQGLAVQKMDEIASALQIFFNFGELYKVVQESIDATEKKITASFRKMLDVSTIGDAPKVATKPGVRTREALNASTWRVTLWDRVDALSEELFHHVLQIWTFQRVLMRKQDPLTFVVFIDAYNLEQAHEMSQENKALEEHKSLSLLETFWIRLTKIIQTELAHGSQSSNFIRNVFMNEYPRLASIFENLFSRIVKQLGSSLSSPSLAAASSQSSEENTFGSQSREALLRSLQLFRTGFLAYSLKELTDPVNLMFSSGQMVPSRSDVSALTVKMHEQMALVKDSQPELQDPVCEGLVQAITLFQSKCLGMLHKDLDTAVFRGGPVPPALRTNSELFNITCFLVKEFHPTNLKKSWGELSVAAGVRMEQCWGILQALADSVIDTLTAGFIASAQDTFKTMNKEDFGVSATVQVDGSPYLLALRSQVNNLLGPILTLFQYSPFNAPTDALNPTHLRSRTILTHLSKLQVSLAEIFVMYASLIYPLKDQGRLKLAADISVLEAILRSLVPKSNTQGVDPLFILVFFKDVAMADVDRLRVMTDALQFVHTPQANFQRVCLAQYLFGCAGLPRSSPALVLELLPEVYVQKVMTLLPHQPEEVFAMLRKVYAKLESQVKIPVGPEGRDFIALNRIHLHLAKESLKNV